MSREAAATRISVLTFASCAESFGLHNTGSQVTRQTERSPAVRRNRGALA